MNPSRIALVAFALVFTAVAARADDPLGADPHVKFTKSAAQGGAAAASTQDGADDCSNFQHSPRPDPSRRFLPLEAGATYDVDAPRGQFKLIVEPSGAAAAASIDDARRNMYPDTFDEGQARMLRCTRAASQVVLVTNDGQLLGVENKTDQYVQPYQIWSYDLNDSGRTRKVVLAQGSLQDAPGLCIRYFDQGGVEFDRLFIKPQSAFEEKNPGGDKAFKSLCGRPLSS